MGVQQTQCLRYQGGLVALRDGRAAVGQRNYNRTNTGYLDDDLQSSSSCVVGVTNDLVDSRPLYRGGTLTLPSTGNLPGTSYFSSLRYGSRRRNHYRFGPNYSALSLLEQDQLKGQVRGWFEIT